MFSRPATMVAFKASAALVALLAAVIACTGVAAQAPCSVTKEVAPGSKHQYHFLRAGFSGDLVCVFTFQTLHGTPLAVSLDSLNFDNVTQSDCECGALRMYDVSPSGEFVSEVRRCAGDAADGAVLVASSSMATLTLFTHACLAPEFTLTVGPPDALGVSPGSEDGGGRVTAATTATTRRPAQPGTREPVLRNTTTTTTTARTTRRTRQLPATALSPPITSSSTTIATTTKKKSWWSW